MGKALPKLLKFFRNSLKTANPACWRSHRRRAAPKKDGAVPCDKPDWDIEAEQVAGRLLREILGERSAELDRQGYLDVHSYLFPDIFYRLRMRQPIEVYDTNGVPKPCRIGVVVGQHVPPSDEFLAKLLWLQTDEARLLATANRVE